MDNMPKIFLTLCMLITLIALTISTENHARRFDKFQEKEHRIDNPANPNDYRLPKSIIPEKYNVKILNIKFNTSTYNGISTIKAHVKESVDKIILNVGDIDITSVIVYNEKSLTVSILKNETNLETETYKIFLKEALKKNSVITIDFQFNGRLRDDMLGFYKSSYFGDDGKQRPLAATQFEATYARHAFPCFDEPEFKAEFEIRIQVPGDYNCLSNLNFEYNKNTKLCVFETTPKMSTYLVAFIVSDFQAYPTNSTYLKMWARPNAQLQAIYGQKIGVKALEVLSELFDENYNETIKKMDMVAVPDFSAGAMENWGLITYREVTGLYDEKHSSDVAQQRVASVIVHECTHMWLGNLVTPAWWSYLWLSEAFARYYQYIATDKVIKNENWKMNEQFIVEQFQTGMAVDSVEDSKPMTRPEKDMITPSQIDTAGGSITYNKGASIVRMMEKTFGTNEFIDALRYYIKDRKLKSAKPDNLWQAIQEFVDPKLDVATIMNSWTEHAGYPYITATVGPGSIKLRQDRFLLRPGNSVQNHLWWVPITLSTASNKNSSTTPVYWLSKLEGEIKEKNLNTDWLILNVQSAGFYRVNYDKDSWNRIIKFLMTGDINKIPVENRAAIIDDLLNFARAEIKNVDYELVFIALQYLKKEKQYLPFKTALTGLDYLTRVMAETSDYDFLKDYIVSLIKNVYDDLSFDDKPKDDRLTILLRQELNNRACGFDNAACIKNSRDYFDDWKIKQSPVPKNQRSVVYCTAIKHGSKEDWDFLYDQYKKSNVAAEQMTILNALGCSQDSELLKKYLLDALSGFEKHRIRKQDVSRVFSDVYTASLKNAEFMIDFANENHEALHKYYKKYDTVGSLITGALKIYPIKRLMDKVEKIVKTNATHISPNVELIKKTLNFVQHEINVFNRNLPPAINKFKETDPSFKDSIAYRLPGYIIPSAYGIHLTPHISPKKNFTFDGKVKITAEVKRSVDKITLHADQLTISNVTVKCVDNEGETRVLENKAPTRREKYQFTDIDMEKPIESGTTISIEITYTGILNTRMQGFYRSSYKIKNEIRWLVATHMEPTYARRVFPCFDEPALKAKFSISVQAPTNNYIVISNTKIKTQKDGLYEFETTPKMSTYLVAVVVSDFKAKSSQDAKYSVYANPLVINQADYALEVMDPVTRWFEKNLGHNYSLDKMDMIALPDFSSGAMENWGLLTYRETNLLYDPVRMSSLANKQSIRNVIAHEITHQWFGDLVSPHCWDYLWLNEGFGRYFQFHAYTPAETDWKLDTQFVVDHLQTSFSTDSATGTHPITHKVYSPTEISEIFDKISYAKAASIIRMFEKLTSPKIFFGGLKRYLDARKYDAAKPEDLFKAFQIEIDADDSTNFGKITVAELMNSWTLQEGFPVVNVVFQDSSKAMLSQTRFYQRPQKESRKNPTWLIPISWTTQTNVNFNNTQKFIFLRDNKQSIEIKRAKDEWIILNLQQTGYYRVNYDEKMWNLIIKALKSVDYTKIHEINRANIVDDLLHLGRAGHVPYEIVFSGLSYLTDETELAPWKAAFNGLRYFNKRFAGHPEVFSSYSDFLTRLLKPTFNRLKFDDNNNDTSNNILLRRLVLDWLCNFDNDVCVNKALKLFKKEKSSTNSISDIEPNKRSYVYSTAIKKGTKEDWDYMWLKFVKSYYATEKMTALNALACSRNPKLLTRLMNETIKKESEIRLQDAKSVFLNIVNNGLIGVETAMDYIQDNYQEMKEYLGDDSIAKTTLNAIAKRVSTDRLLKKFDNLVNNSEKTMPEISTLLKKYLKRAYEEKNWYKEKIPKIFKWLEIDNSQNKVGKPKDFEYRLPTFAKPTTYNILLKPYFEEKDFVFEGEVTINITINDGTPHIVLHSHDLNITEITVEPKNYEIADKTYDVATQKLKIIFKKYLEVNTRFDLKIKYNGKLRDDMRGFYRSSYVEDNKTKWLATTHFEPTYARRAFPCFDEPSFKAYFNITISAPAGYHVLSNAGSKPKKIKDGNRTINIFHPSQKMSSYLVAFVVSQYESTPDKGGRVTVWSRPQLKKYMEYAAPTGEAALQFLEDFTNISYPLLEMNLVSIPDFDMGAMENWGLVTFREYGLTYSLQLTSASYKRYVNTVISHELVHQWFGNLVTCEWWDYTWLNEGFAEYVSYLVSDASEPKWELLKQFVIRELHVGLESDSSESSHAMNNKVFTPTEAQDGFDKIAYQKSASVLRMWYHSFGEKVFKEALNSYLNNRKYDVARPEHLYKAIKDCMKNVIKMPGDLEVDITTVMTSWTEHAGYPVVNATRKNNNITLKQERFLVSSADVSKKNKKYWVPITYTTETKQDFDDTTPKLWLNDESKEISVSPKDKWFLVNIQEIGFYRVNYDRDNWQELINLLNSNDFTIISEVNRAQIIDDSFNLARAGYIKYDVAFSASKYLVRETSYLPWSAYFAATSYLSQRLEVHPILKENYKKHVLSIIDNVYNKLGFEDKVTDNLLNQLNRQLITTWTCKYGHENCVATARKKYENGSIFITPNIATAVYCTAVKYGDSDRWDELWDKYLKAFLATDYLTILRGLGCSNDVKVLKRYLERIIEPGSKIRRQDVGTAFSSVYTASQVGLDTTIQFFIQNLVKLYEFYGDWHDVGSLLTNMAGRISDQKHIDTLEKLANDPRTDQMKQSIESALKVAKTNSDWLKLNEYNIRTGLATSNIKKPEITPLTSATTRRGSASIQGAFFLFIFVVQTVVFVI